MTRASIVAFLIGTATLSAWAAPQPIVITERRITTVNQTRTVIVDGKFVKEVVPVTTARDTQAALDPSQTAIVICDMWDDHWCKSAAERCDKLAKKAAPVVIAARKAGMTIIHCPSDTMDFYKESKARRRAEDAKKVDPPKQKVIDAPALPIDDSDGGCDDADPPKFRKAWTRQHKAIEVDEERDFVSDSGTEVYSILQSKGITTVIVMGVHTNMCVLNRGFAIKQLTKWGVDCLLVRDLTDAMYNPKQKPFVKHDSGTLMVIQHIEQYWCPTIDSKDLLGKK